MTPRDIVIQTFRQQFQGEPELITRAPGRVNLIGEHTDYNDGFVFPMAINRALWIALRPREDRLVRLFSARYEEMLTFDLDDFENTNAGWGEYAKGIAWALKENNYKLSGWEGTLAGDVPGGAGLSSSAAFEMAVARAFGAVSGFAWQPKEMAKLGQYAENRWVGMNCGIMDQMISAVGEKDHALMIDCRSLEIRAVPLPSGTPVVILDSSIRHGLVDSAYNERRRQCEEVAKHFQVSMLRDVTLEQLLQEKGNLDDISFRRAQHVITENQRVLDSVAALQSGNTAAFGKLMNASHDSMRTDFEISCPEMDILVEIAQGLPACYGARMTGGGFGGSAVALVEQAHLEPFIRQVQQAYTDRTGLQAEVYVTQAEKGASLE
ncbi:MAG: galactokinase [Anaerolineales bacterium]|nr:galactokinase [Anaerolineales bacterium]